MAAACHNPGFAKKVGIPKSVACDYNQADLRGYAAGGTVSVGNYYRAPGSFAQGGPALGRTGTPGAK